MRKFTLTALVLASVLATGCTRIQTGEVGVRVDMSKQIQGAELPPGSWNQTLIGEVLTFPTKDITVNLENKTPMTSDNSALADFDLTVVYGINPSAVAELYSTKSKSFHVFDPKEGDTFLMYNYMQTLVNNASYKAVRGYKSLEIADNRAKIEAEIQAIVTETLQAEKLGNSLTLTLVQIRNIAPNAEIMNAATQYVKSVNEIKVKENEVKLAELEAKRQQALSANSGASIAYMDATARLNYSEAARDGKVQMIVVPVDFKGMINVSK
jgi:SPFH domain / Band 7 family